MADVDKILVQMWAELSFFKTVLLGSKRFSFFAYGFKWFFSFCAVRNIVSNIPITW